MTKTSRRDLRQAARARIWIVSLLGAALVSRLLLVMVVFPGEGFSGDMDLFARWGAGLLARGPGDFYAGDASANYPPLAIWLLGGVSAISNVLGGDADVVLLKVPGALADVAIAALVYDLVLARAGRGAALLGAALASAVPVFWYDSSLWGQLDSIEALLSLAALALLIRDHPIAAVGTATAAWLFKPQGVLVLLVVVVVVLAAVLRGALGGHRADVLPRTGRPPTLVLAIVTIVVGTLVVIVPFDYEQLATGPLSTVPVLDDVAGLIQQNLSTAALFPVISVNAFNVWALVGDPSLAASISGPSVIWYTDTLPVVGIPAASIGLTALGIAAVAVVSGLLVRHDGTAILLGHTVLAVAFFSLPTRSHERYLVGAFATMIVLAAPFVVRTVATLVLSVVNTVNLHAVLAGGPGAVVRQPIASARAALGSSPPVSGRAVASVEAGDLPRIHTVSARMFDGDRAFPAVGLTDVGTPTPATYISLPWGAAARQEWVVIICSSLQTAASLALLAGWIVFIVRSRHPAHGPTDRPA